MLSSCLSAFSGSLVPINYTELNRDELKRLYTKSLQLNDGRLIVHGLFARAGTENVNKRVYTKDLLQREVARYTNQHLRHGTALGEMEHPSYSSQWYKCINLPNISHQVLDLTWKGSQLWGTIEVLPTPAGLLIWELYAQGVKLGVSSRGWATLRSDAKSRQVFVDADYELITFDFVVEPSTRDAFAVPVRKRYKKAVHDQLKMVMVAHLGYGAVGAKNLGRLPSPQELAVRVCELREAARGCPPDQQHLALARAGTQLLDNVLLYSHYLVHPHDTFLHREPTQRCFQHHRALLATKVIMATATREAAPAGAAVQASNRSSSSIGAPPSPKRGSLVMVAPTAGSSRAAAVAASASPGQGADGGSPGRLGASRSNATSTEDLPRLASACGGGEEVAREVAVVLEAYLARLQETKALLTQFMADGAAA